MAAPFCKARPLARFAAQPSFRFFTSRQIVVNTRAMASQADGIKDTLAGNKVVVYSKTYCPYCTRVKDLLVNKLKVNPYVIELDNRADGSDIQATLSTITACRTVPQVFVDGQFVGGCDDTYAAYNSGKLKTLFDKAGITAAM